MTQRAARSLYRCLLRLHPEVFRNEFADEMLWIFDQACAKGSVAPLFADALVSIARQWILRMPWGKLPAAEPISASAGFGTFAWKNVALPDSSLPASRVLQGAAVAIAFGALLSFVASRPAQVALANSSKQISGASSRPEFGSNALAFDATGIEEASPGRHADWESRYTDRRSSYLAAAGVSGDPHGGESAIAILNGKFAVSLNGAHQAGQRPRPHAWSLSRKGLPETRRPPCHQATPRISTSVAASSINTLGVRGGTQ